MNIEKSVASMMEINLLLRVWHWETNIAHHHTVYEKLLGENELITDSFMESALGNEVKVDFAKLRKNILVRDKSITDSTHVLFEYRKKIKLLKKELEKSDDPGSDELITILDTTIENVSKGLYLLKLK